MIFWLASAAALACAGICAWLLWRARPGGRARARRLAFPPGVLPSPPEPPAAPAALPEVFPPAASWPELPAPEVDLAALGVAADAGVDRALWLRAARALRARRGAP